MENISMSQADKGEAHNNPLNYPPLTSSEMDCGVWVSSWPMHYAILLDLQRSFFIASIPQGTTERKSILLKLLSWCSLMRGYIVPRKIMLSKCALIVLWSKYLTVSAISKVLIILVKLRVCFRVLGCLKTIHYLGVHVEFDKHKLHTIRYSRDLM